MPTDFPALYARVVAARPEAKIPDRGIMSFTRRPLGWMWYSVTPHAQRSIEDQDAEAIALQHWLGMMGDEQMLMRDGRGWAISPDPEWRVRYYTDPLTALGEYLISTAPHKEG